MKKKLTKGFLLIIAGVMGITSLSAFVSSGENGDGGGEPADPSKLYTNFTMKSEEKVCSTIAIKGSVSAWATASGGGSAGVNYSLGTGPSRNIAYDCASGGALVTCQVIDCKGTTLYTLIKNR